MKGQLSLEYLAAAVLFFLGVAIILYTGFAILPDMQDQIESHSKYFEAQKITNQLLLTKGYSQGDGGTTEWHQSEETVDELSEVGLQESDGEISLEKINTLSNEDSDEKVNITQFRNLADVENQYHFNFTLRPVFEYNGTFNRGDPPSDPDIEEPSGTYESAGSQVRYGETELFGESYRYLIVSRFGEYRRVYFSEDWDFSDEDYWEEGETLQLHDEELLVDHIMDEDHKPGSFVLMEKNLNSFGAPLATTEERLAVNRYGVLDNEPLEIRVLVW